MSIQPLALIAEFKKMLGNLDKWLDSAAAHAKKKSFDPNVFLSLRLAPDQYPFVRQVQISCDNAKFAVARLSGKEAPKHPDTEQTLDELHARIRTVQSYLDTFTAADFAGVEKRLIVLPFLEGKGLTSDDYVMEFAIPNFLFHITTAYAILRHNGVEIGKQDYIGSLKLQNA